MISDMHPFAQAKCVGRHELFDAVDLEDSNGDLIGEHYPYEDTAKALCAECPVLALCEDRNWKLETGIIAGYRPDERKRRKKRRKT